MKNEIFLNIFSDYKNATAKRTSVLKTLEKIQDIVIKDKENNKNIKNFDYISKKRTEKNQKHPLLSIIPFTEK